MKKRTNLASSIGMAQNSEKYDAACKRPLSEKIILANILKACVKEYQESIRALCIPEEQWQVYLAKV